MSVKTSTLFLWYPPKCYQTQTADLANDDYTGLVGMNLPSLACKANSVPLCTTLGTEYARCTF